MDSKKKGEIKEYVMADNKKFPLVCTHLADGHSDAVLTVYATENLLISGSKDRSVRVWDLEKLCPISTLSPHPNDVVCVRYLPESHLVFSASMGHVKLWDLRSENCVKTLSSSGLTDENRSPNVQVRQTNLGPLESQISQLEFNFDKTCLFTAIYNQIRIWDLRSYYAVGKLVNAAVNQKDELTSFTVFRPLNPEHGLGLATGSRDHNVKVFYLPKNSFSGVHVPSAILSPPHADRVTCLATVGADQSALISGSRDTYMYKWDLTNQRCSIKTAAHNNWISSLSSLPGNRLPNLLMSSCRAGYLKLWDTTKMKNIAEIRAHNDPINCLAKNSSLLFTASK